MHDESSLKQQEQWLSESPSAAVAIHELAVRVTHIQPSYIVLLIWYGTLAAIIVDSTLSCCYFVFLFL